MGHKMDFWFGEGDVNRDELCDEQEIKLAEDKL